MELRTFNEIAALNPWLKEANEEIFRITNFITRTQESRLEDDEWDALVTILVGPRQAGKTTLGQYLCQQIISARRFSTVIYLNCDSPIIRDWFTGIHVISELKESFGVEQFILFIDEAQRLDNPGLLIKAIYDLQLPIKLLVSGSSQLEIRSKVQEFLTGRHIEALILPFSYEELPKPKHIEQQVIYGGYPQVVTSPSKQLLLTSLYQNYINKDIIEFLQVGKPAVFEKLMTLIAHCSGQLINYETLATDCGVTGVTVKNYLQILEQTYVIKTITPFTGNKRSEVTSSPKCYYLDNGFRNQALGNYSDIESRIDKGLLIESAVFQELFKHNGQHFLNYKIHFWRTTNGAEVDFVLKQNNECFLPIEVKYRNFKNPKVTRSLRSFISTYQPKQAVVISKNYQDKIVIDSTEVIFIPFNRLEDLIELVNSLVLPYY